MINIEFTHLNAENALTTALGAIENICDEYSIQNHFGTISLAVTETLKQIFECAHSSDTEVDLNFHICNKNVAAEFHCDTALTQIHDEVAKQDGACDEIFTIMRLADNITFSGDNDMLIEFAVQPHFTAGSTERTTQQRHEQVYNINSQYGI